MRMKKLLWTWLNHLRIRMVHHRLPGRWINPICRACDRLWWGDAD